MLFLYNQNPTSGATDGVLVSSDADFSNAIAMKLNSTSGEEKIEKLAIRCEAGFMVEGQARISFEVNDTKSELDDEAKQAIIKKWALSLDGESFSPFGEAITVSNVEDKNVLVYVKCKAEQGELPNNENRLQIVLEGTVTQKA